MKSLRANRSLRIVLYCALFLLSFSVRVAYISRFEYWQDERFQAGYARCAGLNLTLMHSAARVYNPALDFYVESVGIRIFGFNEVGMRIHAVILGASACLLLYAFLYRYFGLISAVFGYVLFTFNPWLIHYSVEGRPYSAAVFCAVAFIFVWHKFFDHQNFRIVLWTVIVQILFLFTIGMQSVMCIISFILFSIVASLLFEGKKALGRTLYMTISFLIAFGIFLPNLNETIKQSGYFFNQDKDLIRTMGLQALLPLLVQQRRCIGLIQEYSIHDYARFFYFVNDYKYLLLVSVVCYILAMFSHGKGEPPGSSRTNQIKTALVGVFISFPFLYYYAFHLVFKGKYESFPQKYILTFSPVVISVLSIGFGDLIKMVGHEITRVRCRIVIYSAIAVWVVVMFGNNLANNREFLRKQVPEQYPTRTPASSWVELFSKNAEAVPGDTFTLNGNVWLPDPPGQRVDIYVPVKTPSGVLYSIVDHNAVVRGIKPIRSALRIPIGWYGRLYQQVIPKGMAPGYWNVRFVVMPSGIPFDPSHALAKDFTDISMAE